VGLRAIDLHYLAGLQDNAHSRRSVRRITPDILPSDRIHGAHAALRDEEGDDPLIAEVDENRLVRADGSEIVQRLAGESRSSSGW
jgi:hypothetical protein